MAAMRSRWHHRPKLHVEQDGPEKRAGWLELFYDLIYVAAFVQLGNGLAADVSGDGALRFAAVFAPLWFAWTGFTFFANRFDVDDFVHRLMVFAQMFAVAAMAVYAPTVWAEGRVPFSMATGVALAVVALLYVRAIAEGADAKPYAVYWAAVFAAAAGCWLVSAALPAPWCYLLWAAGIGGIVWAPFAERSRALAELYPIDYEHLAERFGLLTLIVLGESFVKVLAAVSDYGAPYYVLAQAALTLTITLSLWWIYFDDVAGAHIRKGPITRLVWLFSHLPLQLAVTAVGVSLKKAAFFDLGAAAPAKYRWLLCGALGLALLAVAVIDSVTHRRQAELSDRARVQMRGWSAVVVLLLAPAGGGMAAWLFLLLVTVACVAQVVFDMMMAPVEDDGDDGVASIADRARAELGHGSRRVQLGRAAIQEDIVRKGTPSDMRRDLYFFLMEGSWARVFATLLFLYVMSNVIFAALYLLVPGSVALDDPGSFASAFFFSVQTMSTIGYGGMVPETTYGHIMVTIEAAVGIIGVALATGLMFAKASRPRASVLFSEVLTVSPRDGVQTLSFRVANARGNDIVDANISVSVLCDQITAEGEHLRRLFDLPLVRRTSPFFRLSWTVMHPVDDDSPLADVDWSDPGGSLISLIVTMTGHDGTYGSTVYARHLYTADDLRPGERFVDVISQLDDGRLMIDYESFHATEPIKKKLGG